MMPHQPEQAVDHPRRHGLGYCSKAQMVELADTLDSGSSAVNGLGVQVPLWAALISYLETI